MNSGFATVIARFKAAVNPKTIAIAVFVSGLTACSHYQMTLNEAVMYNPPGLLTDFNTEDPRLRTCLDQTIKDGNFTSAAQITRLICSHAGLTSLKGLEAFIGLREINLENNQITSIQPLQHLSKLEVIMLNDNQLKQVPELLTLPALKDVQLKGNPDLACGDLQQLKQTTSSQLQLPEQCR